MFVAISLSGCDSFIDTASSKKCAVTVSAKGIVKYYTNLVITGTSVRFDFSKDGGESFTLFGTTGSNGHTDYATVGYNLYKNQRIKVIGTATVEGESYSTSATLTYESIPENGLEGDNPKYTWQPELRIIAYQ